jgi:hypothetical protein
MPVASLALFITHRGHRTVHGSIRSVVLVAISVVALSVRFSRGDAADAVVLDVMVLASENAAAVPLQEHVGTATIVRLEGVRREPASLAAALRAIEVLHDSLGFDVLLLPVGVFEAYRVDLKLSEGVPLEHAAITLPREWRDQKPLEQVIEYARSTRASPRVLNIAGYTCDFGPAARTLYPGMLFRFFERAGRGAMPDSLHDDVTRLLGTRRPLHQASASERAESRRVAAELIQTFDARAAAFGKVHAPDRVAYERHSIVNLLRYVEQEDLRAGGGVPPAYSKKVARRNLEWFTNEQFKGKKLIVWVWSEE